MVSIRKFHIRDRIILFYKVIYLKKNILLLYLAKKSNTFYFCLYVLFLPVINASTQINNTVNGKNILCFIYTQKRAMHLVALSNY